VSLATAQNDRRTVPVQQLVDQNAHALVTTVRQRGSLRSKSVLTGSAAPVIALIGKWLQPSGFTQNVQRTQGIVSGQDMKLQSLGAITRHGAPNCALN
jgi:hypothetical protein